MGDAAAAAASTAGRQPFAAGVRTAAKARAKSAEPSSDVAATPTARTRVASVRPTENKQPVGEELTATQVSEIVSSSVAGASYLVALQLFTRMTTFALNQLLLRYTSPATLGVASVQFELLLNTILFLSREGFRCALLRGAMPDRGEVTENGDSEQKNQARLRSAVDGSTPYGTVQKIVNLGYVPLALAMFVTTGVCTHYLRSPPDVGKGAPPPHYNASVILYGLASLIEIASEPLCVLAQLGLFFRVRVAIEASSVVVRCLVTLGLTLVGASSAGPDPDGENRYGVLSFAVAQFLVAVVITGGYAFFWIKRIGTLHSTTASAAAEVVPADPENIRGLLPRPIWNPYTRTTYYFDHQILALGTVLIKQSFLKHVLNEGDKMMITTFCSTHDQGVYAFVVNYGSLVVRILFQPLEESGRMMFSKLLGPLQNSSSSQSENPLPKPRTLSSQEAQMVTTAARLLANSLKSHLILGLAFAGLATNYTGALIDLLVGSRWSRGTDAPATLAVYCMYVPLMGVNGISEAFVQAVATEGDLARWSRAMVGFSALFAAAGFAFMGLLRGGVLGLIAATAINLIARIAFSLRYIRRYFASSRWDPAIAREVSENILRPAHVLPHPLVVAAFLAAWFVTRWSETAIGWETLRQKAIHVAIGVGCFAVAAGITLIKEREYIRQMWILTKTKKRE